VTNSSEHGLYVARRQAFARTRGHVPGQGAVTTGGAERWMTSAGHKDRLSQAPTVHEEAKRSGVRVKTSPTSAASDGRRGVGARSRSRDVDLQRGALDRVRSSLSAATRNVVGPSLAGGSELWLQGTCDGVIDQLPEGGRAALT